MSLPSNDSLRRTFSLKLRARAPHARISQNKFKNDARLSNIKLLHGTVQTLNVLSARQKMTEDLDEEEDTMNVILHAKRQTQGQEVGVEEEEDSSLVVKWMHVCQPNVMDMESFRKFALQQPCLTDEDRTILHHLFVKLRTMERVTIDPRVFRYLQTDVIEVHASYDLDPGESSEHAPHDAKFVCFPYFSLQPFFPPRIHVPDNSKRTSFLPATLHPTRTLLQSQYDMESTEDQDKQRAWKQQKATGDGRIVHVAQLWVLLCGKNVLFTCGNMPLSQLLGKNIIVNEMRSQDSVACVVKLTSLESGKTHSITLSQDKTWHEFLYRVQLLEIAGHISYIKIEDLKFISPGMNTWITEAQWPDLIGSSTEVEVTCYNFISEGQRQQGLGSEEEAESEALLGDQPASTWESSYGGGPNSFSHPATSNDSYGNSIAPSSSSSPSTNVENNTPPRHGYDGQAHPWLPPVNVQPNTHTTQSPAQGMMLTTNIPELAELADTSVSRSKAKFPLTAGSEGFKTSRPRESPIRGPYSPSNQWLLPDLKSLGVHATASYAIRIRDAPRGPELETATVTTARLIDGYAAIYEYFPPPSLPPQQDLEISESLWEPPQMQPPQPPALTSSRSAASPQDSGSRAQLHVSFSSAAPEVYPYNAPPQRMPTMGLTGPSERNTFRREPTPTSRSEYRALSYGPEPYLQEPLGGYNSASPYASPSRPYGSISSAKPLGGYSSLTPPGPPRLSYSSKLSSPSPLAPATSSPRPPGATGSVTYNPPMPYNRRPNSYSSAQVLVYSMPSQSYSTPNYNPMPSQSYPTPTPMPGQPYPMTNTSKRTTSQPYPMTSQPYPMPSQGYTGPQQIYPAPVPPTISPNPPLTQNPQLPTYVPPFFMWQTQLQNADPLNELTQPLTTQHISTATQNVKGADTILEDIVLGMKHDSSSLVFSQYESLHLSSYELIYTKLKKGLLRPTSWPDVLSPDLKEREDVQKKFFALSKEALELFVTQDFTSNIVLKYWGAVETILKEMCLSKGNSEVGQDLCSRLQAIMDKAREIHSGISSIASNLSHYRIPVTLIQAFRYILRALVLYTSKGDLEEANSALANCEMVMQEAVYQVSAMFRVRDYTQVATFESVGRDTLVGLVLQNLSCGVTVGAGDSDALGNAGSSAYREFDVLNFYLEKANKLGLQVQRRPQRQLLGDMHSVAQDLELVQTTLAQQRQCLDGLCERDAYVLPYSPYSQTAAGIESKMTWLSQLQEMVNRLPMQLLQLLDASKDTNEKAIFAFTTVTVIFLPLSFVTSYLGMNTVGIRDMEQGMWVFWAVAIPVTASTMIFTLVVAYHWENLKDWLQSWGKLKKE